MTDASEMFLLSALTEKNPFISTIKVIEWMESRNNAVKVDVEQISFGEMKQWAFDSNEGTLKHQSGKFFTIEGIHVETNWGQVPEWEQPIINQPEIGYLGIITKKIDGILYFLLQAKIEPGNVNNVQLSPTLQATRSNYTQVHQGKKPLYLEYFQNAKKEQILLDQLQSEQGARFLKKRNRNIIIYIEDEIEVHDDFIWLTLAQIKKLIAFNNLVNMDTRTVISGIPFGDRNTQSIQFPNHEVINEQCVDQNMLCSAIASHGALHSFDDILKWLNALKCSYDLDVKSVSLFNLRNWIISERDICHVQKRFFKIIAAKVTIDNREVQSWTQPLVQPMQEGLIAFVYKKINGVNHFLIQAKLECGNFDILEMAPTVQCLTGNYKKTDYYLPYLDYVLGVDRGQIKFDTLQSEEGGRFYREQNRNLIVEAGSDFPEQLPENYTWVTLYQLYTFLKFNNFLNIQTRSLLAAIQFMK